MLVLLAAFVTGCGSNHVRHTQTTLLPDGSVDRAVLLPLKDTPEAVFKDNAWTQTTHLRQKTFDDFTGDIRKLPVQAEFPKGKAEEAFFAGWRKFAPDEKLPEHFFKQGLDETRSSHFEQRPAVHDYGLVTEYVWQETLTEVCEVNDAAKARREFATLYCDHVEFALKHGLDKSYDTTELVAWLRGEGTDWFEELAQIHWSELAKRPRHVDGAPNPVALKRFEDCCRRHQLTVKLVPFLNEPNETAIKAFVRQLIQRTVKRRNGLSVDPDVLTLLAHFGKPDSKTVPEAVTNKWDAAWMEFEENAPGKEAYELKLKQLATRALGVHGGGLWIVPMSPRFQATQTMPGQIVETNGMLLSEGVARWSFTAADAFPDGYDMRVRSIVISPDKLPGLAASWSTDRAAALKLIELVKSDEGITAALRDCRKHRSLDPLKTYADSITDAEKRKKANATMTLLRGS